MSDKPLIGHDELLRILNYDKETGIFTWKINHFKCRKGAIAGRTHHTGYVQFDVYGRRYLAHRMAWFFVHGKWPEHEIDHINGNHSDNRIANLREALQKENARNKGINVRNKSGVKGVSWSKRERKWKCVVTHEYIIYHLGTYDDIELAELIVREAREVLHGEFANHGDRKYEEVQS